MNRTVVFITFSALAGLALIGALYLLIERPDATATFTAFVVQILGLVTLAAGTFYGLGKANEKLEAVRQQTNGTLSHLREESAGKDSVILAQAARIAALEATHPDTKEKP